MSELLESEEQAKIFSALADRVRLRFVRELVERGERNGTEVAEKLGVSLALLCHHSRILVDAGVVVKRKEGQTAYYSANTRLLKTCMKSLLS